METVNALRHIELEGKPDFDESMRRIYAWYAGDMIDRPPVRFARHNAFAERFDTLHDGKWSSLKERWFDTEHHLRKFRLSIEGKRYRGETFPVFWPNLGPDVYAAFYGSPLEFGEITSWSEPIIEDLDDIDDLVLDWKNEYLLKIEELTKAALAECEGTYLVGYTDLHPGLDCVQSWRGQVNLCMDLYDNPEKVKRLVDIASRDFEAVFSHFDAMLKAAGQPSVTWMEIPSFGRMHIPSCDFSALISNEHFKEFALPEIRREALLMTHNVFHMDGKGVAQHLDDILAVPEINAIQWVQGVGDDLPIMQWVPLIKKIQSAGKGVVVDLSLPELEGFIDAVDPELLYLCIATETEEQELDVLKRISRWRKRVF